MYITEKIVEKEKNVEKKTDREKRNTDGKIYFVLELKIPQRWLEIIQSGETYIISYTASARFRIKTRFKYTLLKRVW